MTTVLIFIAILLILVVVHELGHFLVAKISRIRVDEFGIGFPPRIFGFRLEKQTAPTKIEEITISQEIIDGGRGVFEKESISKTVALVNNEKPKKRFAFFWGNDKKLQIKDENDNSTLYSINWIPFGGFVKIFGENGIDKNETDISKNNFTSKNRGIQGAVLVAGIVFNILFAWILVSLGFMNGLPMSVEENIKGGVFTNPRSVIVSTMPNSPAENAGIKAGDSITFLSHEDKTINKPSISEIQNFIAKYPDKKINIGISRGKENLEKEVVTASNIIKDKGAIGISLDEIGIATLPIHRAFIEGARWTWYLTISTAEGLWKFFSGLFVNGTGLSQVSGPVGIASLVGDARNLGFSYLLTFSALISINLAIINLLPFPALDGGRLLFVGIEAIIRRPINVKITQTVNGIGFALLLILMLLVTWHDIVRLI